MNEKVSQRKLKRACIDCHFLTEVRFYGVPDVPDAIPPRVNQYGEIDKELDPYYRGQFRNKNFSSFSVGNLACYFKCWQALSVKALQDRYKTIVETNRNNCPDFFEYTEGMAKKTAIRHRDIKREDEKLALQQSAQIEGISHETEIVVYNWSINENENEVCCNGQPIAKLPTLQFKLFKCLYKKLGKDVKNEILEKCWEDTKVERHNLTTTMGKINRKLVEGLNQSNIKSKSRVIEPKKENKKNVAYKLVT